MGISHEYHSTHGRRRRSKAGTGLRLGGETNTQDTTGEVLEQRPVSVTREELAVVAAKLL